MKKYEQRFNEASYPKITADDLRHLLFDINNQEISVRELRQKLFKLNSGIILDYKVLSKF